MPCWGGALIYVCYQTRYEFLEAVVRIAKVKFNVTTASTLRVLVAKLALLSSARAADADIDCGVGELAGPPKLHEMSIGEAIDIVVMDHLTRARHMTSHKWRYERMYFEEVRWAGSLLRMARVDPKRRSLKPRLLARASLPTAHTVGLVAVRQVNIVLKQAERQLREVYEVYSGRDSLPGTAWNARPQRPGSGTLARSLLPRVRSPDPHAWLPIL